MKKKYFIPETLVVEIEEQKICAGSGDFNGSSQNMNRPGSLGGEQDGMEGDASQYRNNLWE